MKHKIEYAYFLFFEETKNGEVTGAMQHLLNRISLLHDDKWHRKKLYIMAFNEPGKIFSISNSDFSDIEPINPPSELKIDDIINMRKESKKDKECFLSIPKLIFFIDGKSKYNNAEFINQVHQNKKIRFAKKKAVIFNEPENETLDFARKLVKNPKNVIIAENLNNETIKNIFEKRK